MADNAADRAKVFGVTIMLRLDTLEEIERLATEAGVCPSDMIETLLIEALIERRTKQ